MSDTMAGGVGAKLAQVMAGMRRVPKNGKNTFHNYTYTTEADLMDCARPLLAAAGLSIVPSVDEVDVREAGKTKRGEVNYATRVRMTFTVIDGASGERLGPFSWFGEASDTGDKGLYKAITGATKYFLFKLLLVSTGDDPETDDDAHDDRKQPTKPQQPQRQERKQAPPAPAKPDTSAEAREVARQLFDVCGKNKPHAKNAARKHGGHEDPTQWTAAGLARVREYIAQRIAAEQAAEGDRDAMADDRSAEDANREHEERETEDAMERGRM